MVLDSEMSETRSKGQLLLDRMASPDYQVGNIDVEEDDIHTRVTR